MKCNTHKIRIIMIKTTLKYWKLFLENFFIETYLSPF